MTNPQSVFVNTVKLAYTLNLEEDGFSRQSTADVLPWAWQPATLPALPLARMADEIGTKCCLIHNVSFFYVLYDAAVESFAQHIQIYSVRFEISI